MGEVHFDFVIWELYHLFVPFVVMDRGIYVEFLSNRRTPCLLSFPLERLPACQIEWLDMGVILLYSV